MALPTTIDKASPGATDSPALGDDQIRALKLFIEDVFGIPDATSITVEAMNIGSDGSVVINDTSADADFRAEGANNANMIVMDAGQDAISFGGANVDGAAFIFNNLTSRTFITSVGSQIHVPAQTTNFDNGSETISVGAGSFFGIPTWTGDTATLTITDSCTVYIEGIPVDSTNVTATRGWAQYIAAGNVRLGGGLVFINENVNTDSTIGLTINQGANDDDILAFKSSDVAHALTDQAEADTFFLARKSGGASGGVELVALKDADGNPNRAMSVIGYLGEAASTDDTTASDAVVMIRGSVTDGGTGLTTVADTGNVIHFDNNGTCHFLMKGNGDLHASDTTSEGLDEFDDVLLVRALSRDRSTKGMILSKWDEFVNYDKQSLVDAGLYQTPAPNALLNLSQLWRLHNGAIWQNYSRTRELEERCNFLEQRLLALGGPNA